MEPNKLSIDIAAPVIHGTKSDEEHIDALVRAYRADRLQTYQRTIGLTPKQVEKYADTDAANQRARMMEKLTRARAAG